jgi:hypothetical protein
MCYFDGFVGYPLVSVRVWLDFLCVQEAAQFGVVVQHEQAEQVIRASVSNAITVYEY